MSAAQYEATAYDVSDFSLSNGVISESLALTDPPEDVTDAMAKTEIQAGVEQHAAQADTLLSGNKVSGNKEIEEAIASLSMGDFHSRWDSAKRFVKLFRDEQSVIALVNALNESSDPEYQWFLVRILGQYDHPAAVEAITALLVSTSEPEIQAESIKSLVQLGDCAIATLSRKLSAGSIDSRRLAACALARIRRSAVIDPLLSVVRDQDSELRLTAIEALGSFHDPSVTPVLIEALSDEDAIAIEAIQALGRRVDLLETYDLVELLQRCLLEGSEQVAKESAIALGRLGTEKSVSVLGLLLTQPMPTDVKLAAVRALSWINSESAIVHLSAAFDAQVPIVMPQVKQEIAKALGQVRSASHKPTAAEPLVSWLKQLQSKLGEDDLHNSFTLKQTVISSLTWLGAVSAIESLIPLLADADARIQMHVLNALRQIDPRDAKASVERYVELNALSESDKALFQTHLTHWQ